MSWKKAFKKAVGYLPGVSVVKGVKRITGGGGGDSDSQDARADAAGSLIRKQEKRQAGAGQIEYTSETQT